MGIEPALAAWEALTVCLIPIGEHVASRWVPVRRQGWYQPRWRFQPDCQPHRSGHYPTGCIPLEL